ncbi:MAG: hypothetical protein U5L72_07245 [Bacteroidales bacterium]|nr:hypothetical protein [Bacteroidales bacterium]
MKRSVIISVFAALIMMGSCKPIEDLPDEPAIEFRAFTLYDTIDILGNPSKAGKLTFYFEDGDGDLGLAAPSIPGYDPSSNLFFKLYRQKDGIFELVGPGDPLYPSEYRIPYLEAEGQNKILRGTIDVTLFYFLFNTSDTFYYEFWVSYRRGHDSNTASQPCIFVLGETRHPIRPADSNSQSHKGKVKLCGPSV